MKLGVSLPKPSISGWFSKKNIEKPPGLYGVGFQWHLDIAVAVVEKNGMCMGHGKFT